MVNVRIRNAAVAGSLVATLAAAAPGGLQTHDFRIETDQTNSNLNDGSFVMPHRVRFFRPGTDAVGDRAQGNYKTGTLTLSGHVVLHDDGQSGEAQQAGAAPTGGPSTLRCDELQVDSKRKIYTAIGNVVYTQGTRQATADTGKLDREAHTLDLSGNVRLADGDQTLTAQSVHYDTLTKDLSTSGAPVTLTKPAAPAGSAAGAASTASSATSSPAAGTTSTLPTPAASSTLPTPAAKAPGKPK